MRICIPTQTSAGVEAKVSPHFKRAPYFTIYDTETHTVNSIKNVGPQGGEPQGEGPRRIIKDQRVDAVICFGIGERAFEKLTQKGIKFYRVKANNVSKVVDMFNKNVAEEIKSDSPLIHRKGHNEDKSL